MRAEHMPDGSSPPWRSLVFGVAVTVASAMIITAIGMIVSVFIDVHMMKSRGIPPIEVEMELEMLRKDIGEVKRLVIEHNDHSHSGMDHSQNVPGPMAQRGS